MSLKISRILHAGYVFECEQVKIAFDPIFENPFSVNAFAYPSVQFDIEKIKKIKWDAVFISHYHDDHCSLESLNLLDKNTPIYIYCVFEELLDWIKELGFKQVQALELNSAISIGPIDVTPLMALDSDVDSIFHIQAKGLNVLNVVDSWIAPSTIKRLKQLPQWDLVLWPFQTMRELEVLSPQRVETTFVEGEIPEELLDQLQSLKPFFIVPSSCQFIFESWSWYNQVFFPISYLQFQKAVEKILPEAKVIRLNPSVSILLAPNSIDFVSSLDWINPVGEQNVDYKFDKKAKPSLTAEIAKNLDPLSADQSQVVQSYCTKGLIKRYEVVGESSDYFRVSRLWRLSVYNHLGEVKNYFFRLKLNSAQAVMFVDEQSLDWVTEVCEAKLYAALRAGESLTSMYIRINDFQFSDKVESALDGVDLMEDPLVRCLFNGVFGAYQKAQLNKIKS